MIKTLIEIQNELGLHARASAKLMRESSRYASEILLSDTEGKEVNAKSIMGVMTLGARLGSKLMLTVNGEDEHEATNGIVKLINDKFGEHDDV